MMGMPLERVSLIAGGAPFGDFVTVSLTESAESAVRTASFDCIMPPRGRTFPLRPDMPATILVSGALWGTGFIGDVSAQHSESSGSISVTWTSKTVDTVESSIDHPTNYTENKTALEIAREFESAGVSWRSTAQMQPEKEFAVIPGESNFEAVERVAKARGLLIYDDPEGSAVIADKPEGRHSGDLVLGVNIVGASAKLSGEGRHDPVIVKGQSAKGHGAGALRIEARAKDPGVGRKRPLVLNFEGDITPDKAKKRAEWQVSRATGRSREASVTTAGWRDAGGKLWTRNWLVGLDNSLIMLNQDMIIKSVTFSQEPGREGSTQATLSLADPRALGGQKSQGSSDGSWDASESEAEVRAL